MSNLGYDLLLFAFVQRNKKYISFVPKIKIIINSVEGYIISDAVNQQSKPTF